MRHPQIVVFESDGLLARQLAEQAKDQRWLLRETRQAAACLKLLHRHGPSLLVIKLGRNLLRELTLVYEVRLSVPDVPIVVLSDAEDALLQALVFDLGAGFVLQPPLPRQRLWEVVNRLMQSAITRVMDRPNFNSASAEDDDANDST